MGTVTLWGLATLACSFVGSFLGSYFKKKGENLATHEDISLLVDQVSAVTTTTKNIEAKISNEVWQRQRRWEMKRDVLFEMTKKQAAFEDALLNLNTVFEGERKQNPGGPEWAEPKSRASRRWNDADRKFEETILLGRLVCGIPLVEASKGFRLFALKISVGITQNESDIYVKSRRELVTRSIAVGSAIRKELEIDAATEHCSLFVQPSMCSQRC